MEVGGGGKRKKKGEESTRVPASPHPLLSFLQHSSSCSTLDEVGLKMGKRKKKKIFRKRE